MFYQRDGDSNRSLRNFLEKLRKTKLLGFLDLKQLRLLASIVINGNFNYCHHN